MGNSVSTGRKPKDESGDGSRDAALDDRNRADGPKATNTPALVVDETSKRFGSGDDAVLAVDDVSFTVDRGSVVGLLGPNGAGKTTLIKSILGIVLPDTGSVEVFGADVDDGRQAVYGDVDAMLEGARNDYWRLTVRENLRYFATISGVDPDSVSARHDRLLDRLGLTEKADTAVRDLSRGMKQKVSLASVLAGGAELVFLDEPTLGLDVESSRTLRSELRRLASEDGLTIVISSHDMSVIEDVCDRVIVMSSGQIVADDTVDALLQRAGRNTVQVTSPEFDDEAITALRTQFDMHNVEWDGDRARIEVAAAGDELYTLMDSLREAGITVDHVQTVEPDLEDVFVTLTGDAGGLVGSAGERRWSS
ncbi:MAG: ABC transporter ATP-binding protein [Halolamina sp.]|uniref:ABC transporter ATP-binding protein n=1 Tax=Halolamina sp. TaxID=1940283 RepID=UPI002FC362D0